MKRLTLKFTGPYRVAVVEEAAPSPAPGEVLVKTLVSAISPGTELLIYRGEWPAGMAIDATISALSGEFSYPVSYGYSAVGRVTEIGSEVSPEWLDRLVFAFNPHQSSFVAKPESLVSVPDALLPEEAAFLPNMETAVSFLMDGHPLIGEKVVVFGQGVVGLLTTALLSGMPLGGLLTVDKHSLRREKSLSVGAHAALDAAGPDKVQALKARLASDGQEASADLVFELSGNPSALQDAIAVTGFGGRIIVGSWYGSKRADLDLGGRFHRSRITILSSQVSNLAASLTDRWTKTRRLRLAMQMLQLLRPTGLITHRIPISRASEAYELVHQHPDRTIQVMLTY